MCHERRRSYLRRATVREMKEGPSSSVPPGDSTRAADVSRDAFIDALCGVAPLPAVLRAVLGGQLRTQGRHSRDGTGGEPLKTGARYSVHAAVAPILRSITVSVPAAIARLPHRRRADQNAVLHRARQNR